ncbi:MAG: Ppx/GppA phosphatase family protein [Pseudomonadota bacterium]
MNWSTANCAERALSRRRKTFAALDLGTNNCRLLVAAPHRQGFRVVDSFSRIVRLGEGLSSTGRLSDEAIERAMAALKRCAEVAARWDVAGIRCVTTEACRSAANGEAFIARVRAETGLRFDVIDAEEEAALAVTGCAGLVSRRAQQVVVFDIGGGSTEISWVSVDRAAKGPVKLIINGSMSLPFGVVRLSDGLDPGGFAGDHYRGIKKRVAETIAASPIARAAADPEEGRDHLIGTSGTATSLAAFHMGMKRYRRRDIDGTWLRDHEISRLAGRLSWLGFDGRSEQPCIGSGRADLIMPGCAILEGIIEATGMNSIRVADRGLREGIITDLMANANPPLRHHAPSYAAQ